VETNRPTDRLVGAPARRLVMQAQDFYRLASSIHEADDLLQRNVKTSYSKLRQEMVRRELAHVPVGRLRDITGGRLRLGLLENAGFGTVADVLDASPSRLQAIQGVGASTATQVIAAARQAATAAKDGFRLRIDLDPRNPRSTALLDAVRQYEPAGAVISPLRDDVAKVADGLSRSLPLAGRGASRLRMLFSGSKKKKAAREALAYLQGLAEWSEATGFQGRLVAADSALAHSQAAATDVWKDFERRSADYYSLLGEVVNLKLDVHAAEGFLPGDIVKAVHEQELDDSLRRVSLRGYQSFGARFALVQRRVILGDEMGLGKTIEAIAAIAHLKALGQTHFLVVCPASVLVNWTREVVARSRLRAYRLHGTERTTNLKAWLKY